MKLISYTQGTGPRCGLALSETVGIDLLAAQPALAGNWHALFQDMAPVRKVHATLAGQVGEMEKTRLGGGELPLPFVNLTRVEWLSPVILPSKIICVGLNYQDHAEEQKRTAPTAPILFSKAATCLQVPGGPVEIPDFCRHMDAEGELAVIIGKPGLGIPREKAGEHIVGYTCFNDISDREAQRADRQFFRGKSMDTSGPCGPWIVTPDELPDPLARGLDITCRWNGSLMQSSNTDQLIFPVDELVSYISRTITLLPGDIISTGTPGGVGVFRDPPVFLKTGDTVTVEIQGIGKLTNPITRRAEP